MRLIRSVIIQSHARLEREKKSLRSEVNSLIFRNLAKSNFPAGKKEAQTHKGRFVICLLSLLLLLFFGPAPSLGIKLLFSLLALLLPFLRPEMSSSPLSPPLVSWPFILKTQAKENKRGLGQKENSHPFFFPFSSPPLPIFSVLMHLWK